jgi:hypothetical protein
MLMKLDAEFLNMLIQVAVGVAIGEVAFRVGGLSEHHANEAMRVGIEAAQARIQEAILARGSDEPMVYGKIIVEQGT